MAEEKIHHHHHHHHHHGQSGDVEKYNAHSRLVKVAIGLKIGLIILSVYLAIATAAGTMTLKGVTGVAILRNVLSITAWFFIAEFLSAWVIKNTNNYFEKISMKKFSALLLTVSIICGAKSVFSFLVLPGLLIDKSSLMAFYYVGEALAWAGLAVFFFLYFLKKKKKRS